jgi:hypothetical protein
LDFYELPSIFDLIENIPSKLVWKTHIKEKLKKYWKLQVIEGSKDKSSLKHLDVKSLEVNTVHNIWITYWIHYYIYNECNYQSKTIDWSIHVANNQK